MNSPYNQWDAAITVEVAMSDHGDGPLDEIYTRIDDWEPADSLCLVAAQVAQVEQTGDAVAGRGEGRQVQRSARIMLVVKYRTAAMN